MFFDRLAILNRQFDGDYRRIPAWAKEEHLDRILPQAELWRCR